jgi:hypothetical protein
MDPVANDRLDRVGTDRIGAADELEIAAQRRDGTLRKPVTVWVVRAGDDLYVRSAYGRTAAWFRGTQVRHEGRVSSGGITRDVTFAGADPGVLDRIDTAYRTKYRRHGAQYVNSVISEEARGTTTRLVPRQE